MREEQPIRFRWPSLYGLCLPLSRPLGGPFMKRIGWTKKRRKKKTSQNLWNKCAPAEVTGNMQIYQQRGVLLLRAPSTLYGVRLFLPSLRSGCIHYKIDELCCTSPAPAHPPLSLYFCIGFCGRENYEQKRMEKLAGAHRLADNTSGRS